MEYRKKQIHNYNLHTIKTSRFKTIQVIINLKKELRKEEITIRNFLTDMLVSTCEKHQTKRDVSIEIENLYNEDINASAIRSGKYSILSFQATFLNEKYTEEGMNEKSIAFLMELIFHPNVTKKKFDEASFKIIQRSLEDDIRSIKDNPNRYSLIRLFELMAPDSKIAYHPSGYLEDLEKITPETLYRYYQEVIRNSIVDVFLIGDIEGTKLEEVIEQYMVSPIEKLGTGDHILTHASFLEKEQIVKEKMDITQSKLAIGYKVEELTPFERQYVMSLYTYILGGSGDSKLFQNVREKNSLCYYVSASYNYLYHILVITAGIDKKDFKKANTLIQEQLQAMIDGAFDEEDIEKGKQIFISGCKEIEDSPSLLANAYLTHEYIGHDFIEDREKNIKKVTKKMIVALAKKIHLDTVFLLEGEEHHG